MGLFDNQYSLPGASMLFTGDPVSSAFIYFLQQQNSGALTPQEADQQFQEFIQQIENAENNPSISSGKQDNQVSNKKYLFIALGIISLILIIYFITKKLKK